LISDESGQTQVISFLCGDGLHPPKEHANPKNFLKAFDIIEAHHHTFSYGHTHALAEYLRKNTSFFVFVQHPFAYKRFYPSTVDIYVTGKPTKRLTAPSMRAPEIVHFIKDLLLTIISALRIKRRTQLFVGADALNTLSGLILRRLGFTRFVIMFAIDYTPRRFSNKAVNFLYHILNLAVARHCDLLWAVSTRIKESYLRIYRARCPILVVLGGTTRPKKISDTGTIRNRLVFLGNLDKSKGLQIAIAAIPQVKKQIPSIKLLVIGHGPYYSALAKLVEDLEIEDSVEFVGHVQDHQKVMQMLSQCDIGLAPYVPDATNISMYGFPLKIIEYFAAGLPVVTTSISEMALVISDVNSGIIIDYNTESFANAVVRLLSDAALLQTYKKNALSIGQDYSWDNIFDHALAQTIKILYKQNWKIR